MVSFALGSKERTHISPAPFHRSLPYSLPPSLPPYGSWSVAAPLPQTRCSDRQRGVPSSFDAFAFARAAAFPAPAQAGAGEVKTRIRLTGVEKEGDGKGVGSGTGTQVSPLFREVPLAIHPVLAWSQAGG